MSNNNIPLFILTFLLFFIDVSLFFFFEAHYVQLLLCLYLFCLFYFPQVCPLLFIIFLLTCESFYYYGLFWLPFLYLIPFTIVSILAKKLLYFSIFQPLALLLLSILSHDYAIKHYFFALPHQLNYTIIKISGSIIVITCFNLTFKYWGKKGNRS